MSELETSQGDAGESGTTRRDFLQGTLAVAGTAIASQVAGAGAQAQGAGAASAKRPNLLFIYGEGQRNDAVSIAGNPILKTPNHDRIGREGVRFTNAFCTNALCAPARATALTGMYSKSTGALDNRLMHQPLPKDIPLFTEMLREAGYEVAIVGKVHVRNGVKDRYWDYYFGFNAPATDYYSPHFAEGRDGVIGAEKIYHDHYADDLVTDRALAWLEQKREKPFCLLLWFQTPHAPFFRARRHLDLYNDVKIPKPVTFDDDLKGWPGGKSQAFIGAANKIGTTTTGEACRSLEEVVKDYYAGLVAVDENIGRVFDHLEKTGEMEDTAVLQTSDHGFFLGEWRSFDKRFMHEPSIRVPMMVRYPKRIKPGVVKSEMVLDIDIAPTLLDLAGVKIPEHLQGRSIVPLADGKAEGWRTEWFYDYYEFPGNEQVRPHRGVRTETAKLMHFYTEPQEHEMYDLKNDPGERVNLWGNAKYAAMQEDLSARLERLRTSIPERAAG